MENPFEIIDNRLSNIESLLLELKLGSIKTPNTLKPEKEYLTRKETAKLLSVNLTTLWSHTNKGYLRSYKIGSRILYKSTEVAEAINKLSTQK